METNPHECSKNGLASARVPFRDILSSLPVGIFVVDAGEAVVYANPEAERLFGVELSGSEGCRCGDFVACVNRAENPLGCGHSSRCPACPVLHAIRAALSAAGGAAVAGEAELHRDPGPERMWVKYHAQGREIQGMRFVLFSVEDVTGEKIREARLRESEEKFYKVFHHAPMLMTVSTVEDGRCVDLNDAFSRATGYGREEALGATSVELGLLTRDARNEIFDRLRAEGSVHGLEVTATRSDGSTLDCLYSVEIVEIAGKPHLLSIASDVTAYRRSTEEQKKLRKQLANAMEMAQLGHWEYDVAEGLFTFSDQFYKIFNTTAEREGGYRMAPDEYARRFVHPGDRGVVAEEVGRALASTDPEYSRKLEHRMLYADGSTGHIAVRFFIVKDKEGRTVKTHGVNQDITDRKEVELSLRESEEKFRTFTEQSFVGFYIIQDGLFRYVNPKFAAIFGYSVEECLDDMHFERLVHPQDLGRVREQVRRRVAGETDAVQYSFRGIQKTGEVIHVAVYGSALIYRERPAAIGTMLDVTRELEMEKFVARSQRMEAIGSLAGGIAHDFNNILFPIVGLSEMLMEDLAPGSPEHEKTEQICRAGKRGSELVKQILTFSRQSEQKKMPIRIQQVLKEVMKLSRSTIPRNIAVTQEIQSDCRLVVADPTRIHQIAMNLITNAYHAVESGGGTINVRLKEVDIAAGEPVETTLLPGTYALLSVGDTGVGIPSDILDKIFEPYFTTKPQGKGTGLGLAVVYGIVKEHLGEVKVRSELGKGSTFDVYLPIMPQEEKPAAIEAKADLPTGREHILLVDDEESIARLEKEMLERLGYRVTMRVSSLEALEAFRAKPDAPDLVITDMAMPGMTGDALARELIAVRPEIPVIICTGFSERLNRERAVAIGVKGFLMKPIVRSDLAGMVRRVLDGVE